MKINIDFNGLPIGTKLDNQFSGVTFLKYRNSVGGVVVDTGSGHAAAFNDCPGCEFFSTGANIAFSTLQRSVTLKVGLLGVQGLDVQADLRLTAFDASGQAQATALASVAAGAGFGTSISVRSTASEIATVVLEAVNDPAQVALIAVHDLTCETARGGGGPDFALEGPAGVVVLQGGPQVDVPLVIRRFGGSAGVINLSFGPLPAGASGSLIPVATPGNSLTLRLDAVTGPASEARTVVVTGTPMVTSAGPAPRDLVIGVVTAPVLRVSGPADIAFAGCARHGAHGTVAADYLVTRAPTIGGPFDVSLEGLPVDVTGIVEPSTIQFPGWSIGQKVTVKLTTIAGPTCQTHQSRSDSSARA